MHAIIRSGCILGMDALPIDVEVDVSGGLPAFSVVGLPDTAIRESRDRIRSAIKNAGFDFPPKKITVNLSPAELKKEGAGFDLPIALGILAATGHIQKEHLDNTVFCGELSLDGKLKNFRGALPLAISLKDRFNVFVLPAANSSEAAHINDISVYGARSLREIVDHIRGVSSIQKTERPSKNAMPATDNRNDHSKGKLDLKDVKGQEHVKRGLEIAASGGHNILLIGPPGSGKSMLSKRFSTILPDMHLEEAMETTKIYSIAGQLKTDGLMRTRPIRSPHHTVSYASMVGGGSIPRPGEISLAHNGVLFLDEFPEFRRDVLETLRQPLEAGDITITRAAGSFRYYSRFILIAAMNPCPCGYFTDPQKQCSCSPNQIQKYLSKVSGPLLDRIDIHLEVPRLNYGDLSRKRTGEPSSKIKERVINTRKVQDERYKSSEGRPRYNAYISPKEIETCCTLSQEAQELLKSAIIELGISARAYDKILKVSRTIADMESSGMIGAHHISEAIGYRCLDRNLWS